MPTPVDSTGLARVLVVNSTLAQARRADNLQVSRTQNLQAQEATRRAVRDAGLERLDASQNARTASTPRAVDDAIANLAGRLETAKTELNARLDKATSPSARQQILEDLSKVQSAIDGTSPVQRLIDSRQQSADSTTRVPDATAQFQSDTERTSSAARERDPSFSLSPEREPETQAQLVRDLRQEDLREDLRLRRERLDDQAEQRARENREDTRDAALAERDEREVRERELERERLREELRDAAIEERRRNAEAAYQTLQQQRREPRVFDASA